MEINKNNYEAFLLDLWEGTLSEERKVLLYNFLDEHPELNEDDSLNLLSNISIAVPELEFDKSSIDFDQINTKNYEFFFIAYAEGDLSKEEMISVDEFLKENPSLALKFEQFNKSKLPNETILFPNKGKLLLGKTNAIPNRSKHWFIGLVAASIALLFWITSPFQNTPSKYTMTQSDDLIIEKHIDDSSRAETKTPIINLENKIVEQINSNNLKPDKISKSEQSKVEEIENIEKTEKPIKKEDQKANNSKQEKRDHTPTSPRQTDLVAEIKIETNNLPDPVTSIASVRKTDEENLVYPSINKKEKSTTIVDLTASYLQRKNVLNEERKPDFKGILNNTFSHVNENKKPIIITYEDSNIKTRIFQFGDLKIKHKTKI